MPHTTMPTFETFQGSQRVLQALFTDAGIAFDDQQMLHVISGVVDYFAVRPSHWALFVQMMQNANDSIAASDPDRLNDKAADTLGAWFRLALVRNGKPTIGLDASNLYWFGIVATIMLSYPEVDRIVGSVVRGHAFGVSTSLS